MATISELREQSNGLIARVDATPSYDRLRAVYMEMAPLMGAIQGAVAQAARDRGETPGVKRAQHAMESLRNAARQVGFDIRLSTPSALALGLQTALAYALETLDALDGKE